jgi:hypothetical protein
MDPEVFARIVVVVLMDIRTALWALVTAVGVTGATILAHALLTRERN